MSADQTPHRRELPRIVQLLFAVILVPVLLPLVILLLITYLLYGVVLQLVIWAWWCSRGINVLLVYSDSPIWHDYIEGDFLPKLPHSTIVLNWSQRRQWRWFSLPFMAFRFFCGTREFNPMLVVFRPFHWAKSFRFWRAFKDYKHGKHAPLEAIQQEVVQYLQQSGIHTAI